jgi:hypothetical protein
MGCRSTGPRERFGPFRFAMQEHVIFARVWVACRGNALLRVVCCVIATLLACHVTAAERRANAAKDEVHHQRKALVLGRGLPQTDPNGGPTHPQGAKDNFLKLMGNPKNDPRKGWTCDLSWDLMKQLGMDPETTPVEKLFRYIGEHHLGYRIVMQNLPAGQSMPSWGVAVDNGMMPFAPHYRNSHVRYNDPEGFKSCVSVGGGTKENHYSYGQSLEFYDALPAWISAGHYEDAAESWSNQALAAKFARILDAHPEYNIWDAREHLRQAGSHFAQGWSEEEGFGRVSESAVVTSLLPGAPVEFWAAKTSDNRKVIFTWRNFLQSDFAATVIARKNGQIIYDGTGTNFTWISDIEGDEEFKFWSRNQSGKTSRLEACNVRLVQGLAYRTDQTCLVLGTAPTDDSLNRKTYDYFREAMPLWICNMVYRPGNPTYDQATNFPQGDVVAVLPDYKSMVSYAIQKQYRLLIVPAGRREKVDLYQFKSEWDRAVSNGIAVVMVHYGWEIPSIVAAARKTTPPDLFSAIVVGGGITTNERTYGPGLELYDCIPAHQVWPADTTQNAGAAAVAVKLARILDVNTNYNIWDARQHLRQSASHYKQGWSEESGYGRASDAVVTISELDLAPPLEIKVLKSEDGKSVSFAWENFLQRDFAESVIAKGDGTVIYHGNGTSHVWKSDLNGEETFHFYSQGKAGKRSREEPYTVVGVTGLIKN